MDVQSKIIELEEDVQELSLLLKAYSAHPDEVACKVVERKLARLQEHLVGITQALPGMKMVEVPVQPAIESLPEQIEEHPAPVAVEVLPLANEASAPILAERIKPAADLPRSISLNDSFRFSRELFEGDTERMNQVLRRLGNQATLEEALTILTDEIGKNNDNEARIDLEELLKKFFA